MRKLLAALSVAWLAAASIHASEIARGAVARGTAAFVTAADGTLAALDARSGALRWSSSEAMRPLAVQGSRVLAQAASPEGQLRLVVLDAASGRRIAEVPVPLPDGASAPLDDTEDTRFAIDAAEDGARVRLEWTWEFRPMRGVYEEDEEEAAEREERGERGPRRAEGAVLVDLAAARAVPAESTRARGPAALPDALAREADAGAFRERPQAAGVWLVATQDRPEGPVLKRFRPDGTARGDVAVPPRAMLQLGSADGAHVLVSRPLTDAPLESAHEWTVIALDTGAAVGTLRTSTAAAPFTVAATRILVTQEEWEHRTSDGWQREPRRLEAFDRTTGALAWTREIRDGRYRGPVAP